MRLSSSHWWCGAVGVLLALTCFYSFYKLSESPPTWFDEGIYVQVAESLEHTGAQTLQTAPNTFASTGQVTGGYPFLAPVALSLKLFGDSLWAARVPMALFIVVCAFAAFVLVYRLFGVADATLSLLLVATFPLLYGNGKNVLGEVPGMFYTLLALYALWQIERQQFRSASWYVLAGLLIGLSAATKPIFFLLPLAVGIVFLFNVRRIPWRWQDIVWAAVACAAPLVLWAYLQFGGADALSATLFHYANPYAETSLASTVFQNFLRFFKEATPLYCAALMALWLAAVGVRMWRKEKISYAEWVAFVFSILVLLAYLRTEGWYRYFFEAMLLGLVFAPSSLRIVARELERHWPRMRVVACGSLVLLVLSAIQFYQLNYSSWVADHYTSTETQTLEAYFAAHPQTKNQTQSVLVFDAPEVVPFLHSSNYYQYIDIDPASVLAYGKDNVPLLTAGVPSEVITTPAMLEQHPELFVRYTQSDTVGGYVILTPAHS